jgi:hypothetical protein
MGEKGEGPHLTHTLNDIPKGNAIQLSNHATAVEGKGVAL